MTRTAKCCCGQCAIEIDGESNLNAVCHCDNCRRRTGSAFGWSVYFRDEQVRARSGPLTLYAFTPASGVGEQQRYFCAACGTTMFWTNTAAPGLTGMAAGCFAPHLLGPPTLSQLDGQRCAWVTLPDGVFIIGAAP